MIVAKIPAVSGLHAVVRQRDEGGNLKTVGEDAKTIADEPPSFVVGWVAILAWGLPAPEPDTTLSALIALAGIPPATVEWVPLINDDVAVEARDVMGYFGEGVTFQAAIAELDAKTEANNKRFREQAAKVAEDMKR
jgi:hypothetical protein